MTKRKTLHRECRECSADISHRHGTTRFCSNTCKWKAEWRTKTTANKVRRKTYTRTCVMCSTQWESRLPTAQFCSTRCGNHHRYPNSARSQRPPRLTRRRRAALNKQARAAKGTTGGRWIWTQGYCNRCGTQFTLRSSGPARYCTKLCSKRDSRTRHRARKVAAFVEDVVRTRVFNRDGYRCHICHKKTDPTKRVPHPRSPTIDHVIPLAAGGTHEPLNCRTACFICNAHKRDAGGGEQLLLIA